MWGWWLRLRPLRRHSCSKCEPLAWWHWAAQMRYRRSVWLPCRAESTDSVSHPHSLFAILDQAHVRTSSLSLANLAILAISPSFSLNHSLVVVRVLTCTHTDTHTNRCTHFHTHTHTHTNRHTHKQAYKKSCIHTSTQTHTHMYTHRDTHGCPRANNHSQSHTHTHTNTHTHLLSFSFLPINTHNQA